MLEESQRKSIWEERRAAGWEVSEDVREVTFAEQQPLWLFFCVIDACFSLPLLFSWCVCYIHGSLDNKMIMLSVKLQYRHPPPPLFFSVLFLFLLNIWFNLVLFCFLYLSSSSLGSLRSTPQRRVSSRVGNVCCGLSPAGNSSSGNSSHLLNQSTLF